ncbi:MAG: FAD-dependent oxidoreductase, partial [Gammaproteobacteria bacterium]|nr:FAD-dependent oxidoreductase [Gammaproteobacteria bacterium]
MKPTINTQVCVIGAGSGGLSVASGTAQLGLSTVLIEKDKMGGDCLNTGCVPSKALLAAAKHAQLIRSDRFIGISPVEPDIDFLSVKDHVMNVIRTIEPNDSQERFEAMGVKVLRDHARFITPDLIQSGSEIIKAKYTVIATGSRPVIPPINGIETVSTLTNETIFSLTDKPDHLLIVGAGPIGIEMAQAHKRLGCDVSVFDMATLLPRDDKQNVEILKKALVSEGINLYEGIAIEEIKNDNGRVKIHLAKNDKKFEIIGSHLLMAAGRAANTDTLDLNKAGIDYNRTGIIVDKRLRTSRKRVFAIGDVAGGPQFTHIAGYHAGIV